MVAIQRRETCGCAWATAAEVGTGGTGGRHNQAGTKNTNPNAAKANHWSDQSVQMPDKTHAPKADTTMPSPRPMNNTPNSGLRPWRISQPSTRPDPSNMPVAPHKPPKKRHSPQAGNQLDSAIAPVVSRAIHRPAL